LTGRGGLVLGRAAGRDAAPLAHDRAELLALVSRLQGEERQHDTVCPAWGVLDVVARLVHDHLRRLTGARDGHTSPGPRAGETLPAFLNRVDQDFVDVARNQSHGVLADLLTDLGPRLDALWASLDPAAPGRTAPTCCRRWWSTHFSGTLYIIR
jgi:hypothetical protein